jgi:isoquinoline 1-oxidoreductase subunit beta
MDGHVLSSFRNETMDQFIGKTSSFSPSRRDFLIKSTAAGIVVGFNLPSAETAQAATGATNIGAYVRIDTSSNVTVYIGQSDMGQGIMTGFAQLVAEELQLSPSLWSKQVSVQHGTVDSTMVPGGSQVSAPYSRPSGYTSQSTGGSTSMRNWYKQLRQAAAVAREALLTTFKAKTGASSATILNGVVNGTDTYGAIVEWAISTSYPIALPSTAALFPGPYKFIGSDVTTTTPIRRTDIPAKVLGKAVFGIDVRLPGMLHATVLHSPTIWGTLKSLPAEPAGIALIPLTNEAGQQNAIGVVDVTGMSNTWSAMQAAKKIKPEWNGNSSVDSARIDAAAGVENGAVIATGLIVKGTPQYVKTNNGGYYSNTATSKTGLVSDPSNDAHLKACLDILGDPAKTAFQSIDFYYYLPFLPHAPMEVMNATVWIQSGSQLCEIWAPTQSQTKVIQLAQRLLPGYKVVVHTTFLGGGLGRKIELDFILQALQIGMKFDVPIKLTWSRTEDFRNDRYRPCSLIRVRAGLDSNKRLSALVYRNVSTSITVQKFGISVAAGTNGAATVPNDDTGGLAGVLEGSPASPPYAVPYWRTEFVPNNDVPLPPIGFWRSVGESYNIFALESAVDELANSAGITSDFRAITNTATFRKGLLDSAAPDYGRCVAVIDQVMQSANKVTLPSGSARGIAFMKGFGSIIAVIAEVSLDTVKNNVKVNKLFAAVDCGLAINKDAIRAQIEGGLLHGLSAALFTKVTFIGGYPYNGDGTKALNNFDTNPLVKYSTTPMLSVTIISAAPKADGSDIIGGVGELGVPCVAPAIANAFAALPGGRRQRALPFYPGAVMGGL